MIAVVGHGAVGVALVRAFRRVQQARSLSFRSSGVAGLAALSPGTLTFLCWPERIVLERAKMLRDLPLRFVVVSGSLDVRKLPFPAAVFHPLYGFLPHARVSMKAVPVGIAGSRKVSLARLRALARSVGAEPFVLPNNRTLYHAAAVVAGAGVLVTWAAAVGMLRQTGMTDVVARRVLYPIAVQALTNGRARGARRALTGPVVRRDEATIRAHQAALDSGDLLRLYRILITQMQHILG